MDRLPTTIRRQKSITLITRDQKRWGLIQWYGEHKDTSFRRFLCGAGTAARMITDTINLPVERYNNGPLGGDQQIGAKTVEGKIGFVIFFSDPLTAQPHNSGIKALLGIAQVYDAPVANGKASADFMITSPFTDKEYEHDVVNFRQNIADRANTF